MQEDQVREAGGTLWKEVAKDAGGRTVVSVTGTEVRWMLIQIPCIRIIP